MSEDDLLALPFDHLPPEAESTFQGHRAFGYDLATALADLVDNAITASARHVWIDFEWDGPASTITVTDDGDGMNEGELIAAMRLSSRNPRDERPAHDLGRFGLGLKTASLSQCGRFTVRTRRRRGEAATRCWDTRPRIWVVRRWSVLSIANESRATQSEIRSTSAITHMPSEPFIAIGSKGTSLAIDLSELEPPLQEGLNGIGINGVNWKAGKFAELGKRAQGWVSQAKANDPFELFSLSRAVREGRVVHVPSIRWEAKGRSFSGEAFFPADWKTGDPQPIYVAVRGSGWTHGCLERDSNPNNESDVVGRFDFRLSTPLPGNLASPSAKPAPRAWSREELEAAMNIYCKVPFGLFHARNPLIIEVAERMGRSPASLAMKLCNFASLDPVHQARGVKGLAGASEADREIWAEFQMDWETCAYESEKRIAALRGMPIEQQAAIPEIELPKEGLDRERIVRQRVNQCFFRNAVLAAYDSKCCITGLAIPELLNASHIIPWAENAKMRVNPANGLCLNALHDRAFDRGFITIGANFRVVVSPAIHRMERTVEVRKWLIDFHDAPLRRPDRFAPDLAFLAWHREHRFQHAA